MNSNVSYELIMRGRRDKKILDQTVMSCPLTLSSRTDRLRCCPISLFSSPNSLSALLLRSFIAITLSSTTLLSQSQLLKSSLSESCLSRWWREVKLPAELRVDSFVRFLRISENSESSLLRWDSLRIWLLRGLRESLRADLKKGFTGWLSFRTRRGAQGKEGRAQGKGGRVSGEWWRVEEGREWSRVEVRAPWLRVSRQCMDCRLKSCTARSSMLRLDVSTISLRGRKYLTSALPSERTAPQRLGLKEVRMECLARQMASSMNCLWRSFTDGLAPSSKTSSRRMGTYPQQRSRKPQAG